MVSPQSSRSTVDLILLQGDERFSCTVPVVVIQSKYGSRLAYALKPSPRTLHLTFVFRYWNHQEELAFKKQATMYDDKLEGYRFDIDLYNDVRIRSLLMEWNLGEHNSAWKLVHVNDVVTDEAFAIFSRLPSFVRRAVIQRLAEVLDFGR